MASKISNQKNKQRRTSPQSATDDVGSGGSPPVVWARGRETSLTPVSSCGNASNINPRAEATAQLDLQALQPLCTCSVSALRESLRLVSSKTVLDEANIAQLIHFFSYHESRHLAAAAKARSDTPDEARAGTWDPKALSSLLAEDYAGLGWTLVARSFDFPTFGIRDANHLKSLLRLYESAANMILPLSAIVAEWENRHGQLSLILEMLSVSRDVYTFELDAEESLDAGVSRLSSGFANPTGLASSRVLQRLLILSDDPSLYHRVCGTFTNAIRRFPEILLCSLVRLRVQQDDADVSDVAIAVNTMRRLLALFFKSPAPNRPVQNGPSAICRLWSISSTTVVDACIEAWRGTVVQNDCYAAIVHIISIIGLLPNADDATGIFLNGSGNPQFSVAVAFVMADKDLFQLRPWLVERSYANDGGSVFIVALISYLKRGYKRAQPRGIGGNSSNVPLVSLENLAVSLQFLQSLDDSISSSGIKVSADALIKTCLDTHPSLNGIVDCPSMVRPSVGTVSGPAPTPGSIEDIEEVAGKLLRKLYTSERGLTEVIELLKKMKWCGNARDNDIFACMIHNLFDEYRFFERYPEKELRITGLFFGALIQHRLVSSITLGIALRYILEGLRKNPNGEANSPGGKMFRFGMVAIEQCKERLYEWPKYCSHIAKISHLRAEHPDFVAEVEAIIAKETRLSSSESDGNATGVSGANAFVPTPIGPKNAVFDGNATVDEGSAAAVATAAAGLTLSPTEAAVMKGSGVRGQQREDEGRENDYAATPNQQQQYQNWYHVQPEEHRQYEEPAEELQYTAEAIESVEDLVVYGVAHSGAYQGGFGLQLHPQQLGGVVAVASRTSTGSKDEQEHERELQEGQPEEEGTAAQHDLCSARDQESA